jgi:MerR family transcriptional regulator, copper efflux regulator
MVVRFIVHALTLTVEPGFKSSVAMTSASDLTIGDIAARAGVPTSTVRYYERRGLVLPDGWQSGQRRYEEATLRRLVFVGMLQDAGLSLDDIAGVLGATRAAEWKGIARERLAMLDATIAELQLAREYLAGALLCRYDHPATDCKIMGAEIDRRLGQPAAGSLGASRP